MAPNRGCYFFYNIFYNTYYLLFIIHKNFDLSGVVLIKIVTKNKIYNNNTNYGGFI